MLKGMDERDNPLGLSEPEQKEAQEKSSVTVRVVHDAVRREGEEELERSSSALAWSGLAAGLSMGFSLMAEGLLRSKLPDMPWRKLISGFGYSTGFVIVILGRQQLFTEKTLTPILPLLQRKEAATFWNVARLWGLVLVTNLLGAVAIAWVLGNLPVFNPEVQQAFGAISKESLSPPAGTVLLRGIFSGWLIALLVWVLPFAESSRFFAIIAFTWLIGVCGFSHVIAGSVEAFYLAATGGTTWGYAMAGYILPVLLGNVIGGVALVSAFSHAQATA
jgi:formate-nitrite transporter family protein